MKKVNMLLVAAFAVISVNGFSQTTVELGVDWDPVAPKGIYKDVLLAPTIFSYDFEEASINIKVNATISNGSKKDVYVNTSNVEILPTNISDIRLPDQNNYVEVMLTEEGKQITGAKINGTSASTGSGRVSGIIYSGSTTFDENNITGYEDVEIPACRAGEVSKELTSIPTGTKSLRIYGGVRLIASETIEGCFEIKVQEEGAPAPEEGEDDGSFMAGSTGQFRLAYISVTTDTYDGASIDRMDTNRTIVQELYYDLAGQQVQKSTNSQGVLIQKNIYDDGSTSYRKVYLTK